jgi:zinc D-Ala-D-Ala carboxypeptidase
MAFTSKDLYRIGGLLLLFVMFAGKKKALAYFKITEFESPDQPGSGANMHPGTLLMLDQARHIAGVPFGINSGYRTEGHNDKVGGVTDSSHTRGLAADIKINSFDQGQQIAKALYAAGFRRFGIANTFIHVDNDLTKPPGAVWGYPQGTPPPYYPADL